MLNKNRKISVLATCVQLCLTLQRKQLKREKIDQGPYTWWWEQVVRRGLPTVDRRREGVRWGPGTTCKGILPTFRITPLSESKLPIGGPMGTFHIQTTTRKTQKPTSQEKGGGAAVIFFTFDFLVQNLQQADQHQNSQGLTSIKLILIMKQILEE